MVKVLVKCGYCGIEWVDEEASAYRSHVRRCAKCGEIRNLATKPFPAFGRDVFGYRFDHVPAKAYGKIDEHYKFTRFQD